MDDLDRLFRRLVQNIRNGYPEYATHPFEVSELYQNLIPYRHNRRELEIETNQDYEVALCRLLSGERNYLIGDEVMEDTIRRELASPNPNTAIFRDFAASRVQLHPESLRQFEGRVTSARDGAESAQAETVAWPRASGAASTAERPAPSAPVAARPSIRQSASLTGESSMAAAESGRASESQPEPCRYCGGALPSGRRALFCPSCGQNLMVQRCPACGTELELNWRYCITCGRGVGAS